MDKQKLAQKRNYFKYQLMGMIKAVDSTILTEEELGRWNTIKNLRNIIVDNFDNSSTELGLNVPKHRCWCRKEAKYQLKEPLLGHGYWVCKNHLDE